MVVIIVVDDDTGASPDALIYHADGTMEVAEVKCSSPFQSPSSSQGRGSQTGQPRRMIIGQNLRPYDSVGSWHIPQLQLEILCAGPKVVINLFLECSAHIYKYQLFCV